MAYFKGSFIDITSTVGKYIIKTVVVLMTFSLVLGTGQLMYVLYTTIVNPPYAFLIDVKELYSIFKLCLIIVVGYELLKSLLLIIDSDSIPVSPIISIGIIAIVNKVITLDFQTTDGYTIAGMAALILALAVARFLVGCKWNAGNSSSSNNQL